MIRSPLCASATFTGRGVSVTFWVSSEESCAELSSDAPGSPLKKIKKASTAMMMTTSEIISIFLEKIIFLIFSFQLPNKVT